MIPNCLNNSNDTSAPGPQPASIANRFCPGMKPSGTSSWPPGKRQHANLKKKHSKGARKNNRCKDPANSNEFNITDYGTLDDP